MTLIRESGELVAVVGRTRAYLLPHVEHLPDADQLRRRALAKCLYALAIATGRRPGLYRELEAQAFALRLLVNGGPSGSVAASGASLCSTAAPCRWGTHAAPTRQEARWPPPPPNSRSDAHSASRATPPTSASALVGQRVDGAVRISDVPADGRGRSYLVEPEIGSMPELEALVADYQGKAARLGYVPMHGWS